MKPITTISNRVVVLLVIIDILVLARAVLFRSNGTTVGGTTGSDAGSLVSNSFPSR